MLEIFAINNHNTNLLAAVLKFADHIVRVVVVSMDS